MGTVLPFPAATSPAAQVVFERSELNRIVDLYGRMVAAGQWKDYAIEFGRDHAAFSCFRRSAERPEYRIEKRPALRARQGMWALVGEHGATVRRGHELGPILAPIERRLLKVVANQ
ncbi:MAG TPA: DUF2794 domain-containing protein [Allosphingosinicella sp.]|jgi:hypothetical protein